ncbi:MAG: efflux RND transporter permease subunit, partial [Gammaproteobacteria bacterium]|nr:efflux RND transporter permease subunit [Gammaproteobacteria bacterium]
MNFLMLSIRRPVAVGMFFLGIVLVGGVAWKRMPVELFPALSGDRLTVNFRRPGSEPEVIEREILLPLQARTSSLPHVSETWGEIRGTSGRFQVRFESGADIKIRELELQRLATTLQRAQPRGTSINVTSSDSSVLSSFVMMIHVLGGDDDDLNTLHDLVVERIAPRFAAVTGISQALVNGGAPRQVTVTIDPDRAAALGMTTDVITQAVKRNVGHLEFVGALESEVGRTSVILDGRPEGLNSLSQARVRFDRAVRIRHVSEVTFGNARETTRFRVNGQPAVGLVLFQEQGANLVRLGADLRNRLEEVREELKPLGLDLVIGFDAARMVEDQISRLARLGASGFVIALLVLFLFLRQWRAVAVVGLAVPISLLASLSLLFLMGQSFNLITLFGMFVAIGLVVDNSVVVYEAVQRRLEQGADIEKAVRDGLRRTVRAIVAASATTAVVFLPLTMVDFNNEQITALVRVVTLSVLLPLGASLVVAVGLVPLLAHRLAAPAALRKLAEARDRRSLRGDLVPPDRARLLFGGIVARALRHPPAWISGTVVAVLLTGMIALPWVMVNTSSQEPPDGDTVQLSVRFPAGQRGVEATSIALGRLERAALDLEGVRMVEALASEDGGSLTVHLKDERPAGFRSRDVRNAIRRVGEKVDGLEILRPGEDEMDGGKGGNRGGGGGPFEGGPAEIVLSGPESAQLQTLARSVSAQLQSMPEVAKAWMSSQPGLNEIWVEPNQRAFEAFGLTFDEVLPFLNIAGREGQRMQTGFVLPSGRELPLVIERSGARNDSGGSRDLRRLRVQTNAGVVPVAALASMRRMPAPPTIVHHNGRREIKVFYRLSDGVPSTGPGRLAIEEQILGAVRSVPRPRGYTVETVDRDETTNQLQQVVLPAILLLFLVLAMTFESLTLPVLVLISLPLTLLGATWALAFAGMPLGMMAMLGAMALIGLTVNPGILLVDRMQQLVLGAGWSSGGAALSAVRERTRPVMMTTATTIAGLWPLAIVTGRENEIWPPFATIVIGGLVTSSLLTLLMIPVGFVLLRKLDSIFGRVGPWLVLTWLGSTALSITVLILTGLVTSTFWQVVLSFLIGGLLLTVVVLVFRPRELPEPEGSNGPPKLEVRYLHKIYGLPG